MWFIRVQISGCLAPSFAETKKGGTVDYGSDLHHFSFSPKQNGGTVPTLVTTDEVAACSLPRRGTTGCTWPTRKCTILSDWRQGMQNRLQCPWWTGSFSFLSHITVVISMHFPLHLGFGVLWCAGNYVVSLYFLSNFLLGTLITILILVCALLLLDYLHYRSHSGFDGCLS